MVAAGVCLNLRYVLAQLQMSFLGTCSERGIWACRECGHTLVGLSAESEDIHSHEELLVPVSYWPFLADLSCLLGRLCRNLPTNGCIKAGTIQGVKLWEQSYCGAVHGSSCQGSSSGCLQGNGCRKFLLFNELHGNGVLQWSALHLATFFSSDIHLVPNKNVFKRLVAVHLEAGTTQD